MLNTFSKELKELFADIKIWIVIITVLIIIIIGTSYNRKNTENISSELLKLGVINYDDSSYSELLLNYFNSSETFSSLITVVSGENDLIKDSFRNGELDIYLEIPVDFAMNMVRMEHSKVKVTINIEDTTKAILFQSILKSYEKYIAAVEANAVGLYEIMEADGMDRKQIDQANVTISMDMIFTALGKEIFFAFEPVDKFPSTTLSQYYLISILVMTMMYTGLYVGFGILRERKQGTFRRIRTTKLPIFEFLTVKILFMVVVFTTALTFAINYIRGGNGISATFFFSLSISMFCIALATMLCGFFNTSQRYILAGNLLIFYFLVIGGGIIPIQFLPQDIIKLSKMTPNYYMIKGIIHLLKGQHASANVIALCFLSLSILLYGLILILFYRRSVTYEKE